MKRRQLTKMLSAAALATGLMGCSLSSRNSKTDELPSFDDLVGYIKDGTFTARYIPKPHKVAKFAIVGNTYFTHRTSNAAAEFERFLSLYPMARLSGVTLYSENPGGVPANERSHVYHPDTYRGSYFKYSCPISSTPFRYEPTRVKRITPTEWNAVVAQANGNDDFIHIPISDYPDENEPYATLKVGRTADRQLQSIRISISRGLRWYDLAARTAGATGVVVRSATYGFITRELRE